MKHSSGVRQPASEPVARSFVLDDIFSVALSGSHKQAIVSTSERITFGQLFTRATRLRMQLEAVLGSARGIVAVCTSEVHELVVAALAAWQLRCAYLVIDPLGPIKRNQTILADADPRVIIANNRGDSLLSAVACPVLTPELGAPVPATHSNVSEQINLRSDDLAYVIYTSGSTGQPKGVEITHGNLRNLIAWHRETFHLTPDDIGTQFASLTFDATVLELWPVLACGATIYVPERSIVLDPENLRDFLIKHQVTISFAATPVAERLLELTWPSDCRLRYLLTGGDALKSFPRQALPFQLINNYGPTECTVLATSGVVSPRTNGQARPSIGQEITGTDVFILDGKLQPIDKGLMGQIAIAGRGVGAGYLGRPELTKERFVNDCWPGARRMYLTGDRGRRLPNGTIEFCGRIDDQIKILGHRIEPGEIISALCRHPQVISAGIAVVGDDTTKRLVACLVARTTLPESELRVHLEPLLPAFMIPDTFVQVSELPMTKGMLDHAAITAACSKAEQHQTAAIQALRSEIEVTITGILSSVLKGVTLRPSDNFFRLGGHSLLAAQVIALIRREFRLNLELRVIFEHPTIAGLSKAVERNILQGFPSGGSVGAGQSLAANGVPQC